MDGNFGAYKSLMSSDVDVEITKWYPQRSLTANGYAWALIRHIASKTGDSPVETYRRYIRDHGVKITTESVKVEEVEANVRAFLKGHIGRLVDISEPDSTGEVVITKHYGSSDFDSMQMGLFIESIEEDCRILRIPYGPKGEVEKMVKEWGDGRNEEDL